MKSILRQIRISPKKVNLVAALVRNKKVTDAVSILKFTPKKSALVLKKVIESAAANAENNFKQNKDDLYIKEIIVTEGTTLKRSIPVSRGRTHPILKRTAHITVKLEVKEGLKPKKAVATKAETEVKTEKPAKKTKVKKSK